MKRDKIKAVVILLIGLTLVTQSVFGQENYIRLIGSSGDTIKVPGRHLRFNGCTRPGSVLTINGNVIKVFASGAFAAFPEFSPGINQVEIVSEHPQYGRSVKRMWVESLVPSPLTTTGEFKIESVQMIPDQDQWLVTGDIVTFRVKAQPGNKVEIMGKRLFELPDSITGGIGGIYQCQYHIASSDTLVFSKVIAEMTGREGMKDTLSSETHLTINSSDFNRYARTNSDFSPIYIGLGSDRLGGAKYGYLDRNVLLKITGRVGDMERVSLGDNKIAWVSYETIDRMPEGFYPATPMLTGSFSVKGDDESDYLRIPLPEKLPYTSSLETDPARIEVDIYGVASNTNWITQMSSVKEIKNIYYHQISTDILRVTIELNHHQPWGYSISYENNTMVVKVKHQPESLKLSELTVAIDAGHGGTSDGAISSTGIKEKDVNLMLALKLKSALEKKGVKVILTRDSDTTIYNIDRWKALVPRNPDILISIHNNSVGNSNPLATRGTSTYYKYIGFRPLSVIMYDELRKCGLSEGGNVGSFNFTLNSPTEFINVLLEVAFMSNPEDEMLLMDNRFCDKVVSHVVKGLDRFLNESSK